MKPTASAERRKMTMPKRVKNAASLCSSRGFFMGASSLAGPSALGIHVVVVDLAAIAVAALEAGAGVLIADVDGGAEQIVALELFDADRGASLGVALIAVAGRHEAHLLLRCWTATIRKRCAGKNFRPAVEPRRRHPNPAALRAGKRRWYGCCAIDLPVDRSVSHDPSEPRAVPTHATAGVAATPAGGAPAADVRAAVRAGARAAARAQSFPGAGRGHPRSVERRRGARRDSGPQGGERNARERRRRGRRRLGACADVDARLPARAALRDDAPRAGAPRCRRRDRIARRRWLSA